MKALHKWSLKGQSLKYESSGATAEGGGGVGVGV